jgi:hypothetical protein
MQVGDEAVRDEIYINQMNIEVFILHRKDRLNKINREIIYFAYINILYFVFGVFFIVRQIYLKDVNCELSLSILVFHYILKIVLLRNTF